MAAAAIPAVITAAGSIAGGALASRGKTSVGYSPGSQSIYDALMPIFGLVNEAALKHQPLYALPSGYPSAPTMPSLGGYIGNIPSAFAKGWHTPTLKVPDYNPVVPTKDWWSNLTPSIKQGIMQPFEEGSERLREQLNKVGQLGSARGGVSGVGATGMSNYWADAMPKASLTGWQQYAPGMMAKSQAEFAAQTAANTAMWQDRTAVNRGVWQMMLDNAMRVGMTDYDMEKQTRLLNYGGQEKVWQAQADALSAPFRIAGSLANAASSIPQYGSYSPNPWSGALGGLTNAGLLGLGMYGSGLFGRQSPAGGGALGGGYPFGGGGGALGGGYGFG